MNAQDEILAFNMNHVPVVAPDPWRAIMSISVSVVSLVVGIGVLAGCSSIQPPQSAKILDTSTHSLTVCQKADSMWNDKIIPTIYGDLPALTSPGVWDIFKLAQTSFTIRSLYMAVMLSVTDTADGFSFTRFPPQQALFKSQ